jgi:hypothetical protein
MKTERFIQNLDDERHGIEECRCVRVRVPGSVPRR